MEKSGNYHYKIEKSRTFSNIQLINLHILQHIYQITMLDWEGLLKFSLQHTDGTTKTDFKEMSDEDKKFLEGALSEFCQSEVKRISAILAELEKPEQNNQQQRTDLLEELQEILDSLDKGNVLYKLGGHITLLKIIFYSKFTSNKIVALQIFSSANQNDASVQTDSINSGAMELTDLIRKQEDMKLKENLMGAISALIRGENLEAKRIFIRIGGLQLLKGLYENQPSDRLKNKMNILWRDLQYYDEYLHQTYNDLSSFSNTTGLKMDAKNCDLKYDINEEMKDKNFLPQNQKYKGMIRSFLKENPQLQGQYQQWLKKQE